MSSSTTKAEEPPEQKDQEDQHSNGGGGGNNNDLVIRDGFPALHLANRQPNIDGDEPLPRHAVWADAHALTSHHWNLLQQDAATVFTARTRDDDQAYSAGTTYFWPCRMPPRCALEALVRAIFECHTREMMTTTSFVPEQSGAEWWTLVLDDDDDNDDHKNGEQQQGAGGNNKKPKKSDDEEDNKSESSSEEEEEGDEVGLHFDADYGLEAQAPNLLLHPRIASVTYLSPCGSPTVVLDQKSPPPNDLEKKTLQGSVRKAWLSRPVQGKHLAFDGRLLHGAPSTFFPGTTIQKTTTATATTETKKSDTTNGNADAEPPAKRIKVADGTDVPQNGTSTTKRMTLLVNIWLNHCPLDAEPLEDEIIEQMKTPFSSDGEQTGTGKTNGDDVDTATATTQLPFTWNPSLNLEQPTTMPQVSLQPSPDNPAGSEEVVICGRLVTVHYGASMEDFHKVARCTDGDMVELQLDPGVISLHVGDAVADEDDY